MSAGDLESGREKDETKLGLLEQALPGPDSPHHSPARILSTSVILLFLIISAYGSISASLDIAGGGAISWRRMQWIYGPGVSIGEAMREPQTSLDRPVTEDVAVDSAADDRPLLDTAAADSPLLDIEAEDGMNPQLLDDDIVPHVSSKPDLGRYLWHSDLKFKPQRSGRLIIVGDVHGMADSLKSLIEKLDYDATQDEVVLAGDLLAKAPKIRKSLEVIRYARQLGFKAIRGNHDQAVIGWRAWQEWFARDSIDTSEDVADDDEVDTEEVDEPADALKAKVPKGWKWRSQHYAIARKLSKKDYDWLLNCPLTIHVRNLHAYIVHAGLMPTQVPRSHNLLFDSDDDTAFPDLMPSESPFVFTPERRLNATLTESMERRVLSERANRDPYTLLNMRTVTKHGTKPDRDGKKGKPWMSIWNDAQDDCATKPSEECRPLTVVYGHWASRGVEARKWSVGLDSGCVYGRRLTALVFEGDQFRSRRRRQAVESGADDDDQPEDSVVETDEPETEEVGVERLRTKKITIAGRTASLVSVPCSVA